jgi:hypothetical protein
LTNITKVSVRYHRAHLIGHLTGDRAVPLRFSADLNEGVRLLRPTRLLASALEVTLSIAEKAAPAILANLRRMAAKPTGQSWVRIVPS